MTRPIAAELEFRPAPDATANGRYYHAVATSPSGCELLGFIMRDRDGGKPAGKWRFSAVSRRGYQLAGSHEVGAWHTAVLAQAAVTRLFREHCNGRAA